MTIVSIHFHAIRTIRRKAPRRLFENGDRRGIGPDHVDKVERNLARLNVARTVEDVDAPGFRLHPLKGNLKGYWAVIVRANWRIIFRFEDGHALAVDLVDYQ